LYGDRDGADIDPETPRNGVFRQRRRKEALPIIHVECQRGKGWHQTGCPSCRKWIWWDSGNIRQTVFGMRQPLGAPVLFRAAEKQTIGSGKGETEQINPREYYYDRRLFGDWRKRLLPLYRVRYVSITPIFRAKDKKMA
jgi:hypothetical protein